MAFRQSNFHQRLSQFTPEIEEGIRKNFSAYMDMVKDMSQEAFAPHVIIEHVYHEKELLDKFKMAVDSLDLLMHSPQAKKEGEMLTKFKKIESGEYKNLLQHREKRTWSALPVSVNYGENAVKQVGLVTDLIARAPDVFEDNFLEMGYGILLRMLRGRAKTVNVHKDFSPNLAAEYARQEREFPIYKDKFLEIQRKLLYANQNPPAFAPDSVASIAPNFTTSRPSAPPYPYGSSRASTDSEHSSDDDSPRSGKSGNSSDDEASAAKKSKVPSTSVSHISFTTVNQESKSLARPSAGSRAVSPARGQPSVMGLMGSMHNIHIAGKQQPPQPQPSAPSLPFNPFSL